MEIYTIPLTLPTALILLLVWQDPFIILVLCCFTSLSIGQTFQYHIMDRVRKYENVRNIAEEVLADKHKEEMYNTIMEDCQSLDSGCAGRLCKYDCIGGTKEGVIEVIDYFKHTAVIYSLEEKCMIEKPMWEIVEYRGVSNR